LSYQVIFADLLFLNTQKNGEGGTRIKFFKSVFLDHPNVYIAHKTAIDADVILLLSIVGGP